MAARMEVAQAAEDRRSAAGMLPPLAAFELAFEVVAPAFLAGSRDSLRRYYERSGQLLQGARGDRG